MKKKVCAVLLGTALTCHVPLVYGAVQDYQAVTKADKEDNKTIQTFQTEDGDGNAVTVAAVQDTLYVMSICDCYLYSCKMYDSGMLPLCMLFSNNWHQESYLHLYT